MPDEMLNVRPNDVEFMRKLKQSERSVIFQVTVRGKECVMKVVSPASTHVVSSQEHDLSYTVSQ